MFLLPVAGLSLLLLGSFLGVHADARRSDQARAHILYLPSGSYLKLAATGFRSMLADAIYLWSIQYASNRHLKGQEHYLPRVFDVITDLDPRFDAVYTTGAFILADDVGSVPEALRLLEKGFRQRGNFFYLYDAGFYCFMVSKDYEQARSFFVRAAAVPGCPVYVRRLAYGMAALVHPRDAYALYRGELERLRQRYTDKQIAADPELSKHFRLVRHRLSAMEVTVETGEIEKLLKDLVEKTGSAPRTMRALRRALAQAGISPHPLAARNDPFMGPSGTPYVLRDGHVVDARKLSERTDPGWQ